jgi:hypothetical protein
MLARVAAEVYNDIYTKHTKFINSNSSFTHISGAAIKPKRKTKTPDRLVVRHAPKCAQVES